MLEGIRKLMLLFFGGEAWISTFGLCIYDSGAWSCILICDVFAFYPCICVQKMFHFSEHLNFIQSEVLFFIVFVHVFSNEHWRHACVMYSCLPFDYDYTSHSLFIAFSWLMDLHIWFTFFWLRSVISKWAIDDQIPFFFRWHGGWFANGKSPSWITPSFGEYMFPTTTQRSQIQVWWPECFRFFRWLAVA